MAGGTVTSSHSAVANLLGVGLLTLLLAVEDGPPRNDVVMTAQPDSYTNRVFLFTTTVKQPPVETEGRYFIQLYVPDIFAQTTLTSTWLLH